MLEDEIKNETGLFSTSPTKKVTVSIDDDLFGPKKQKDDDLFTPVSVSTKPRKADDALFNSSSSAKSKPSAGTSASLFDKPPEDIFKSDPPRQVATGSEDIFASSYKDDRVVGSGANKKLDDLLGSPVKKSVKAKKAKEDTDAGQVGF